MADIKIVEGGVCEKCNKQFDNDAQGNLTCGCPDEE